MNRKQKGAFVVSLVLFVPLVIVSWMVAETMQERCVSVALLVFGTTVGWVVGTALSPRDTNEKTEFSTYIKAFAAFGTGYGAAKIDGLVEAVLNPDALLHPLSGVRMLSVVSAFLIAMLMTFVVRSPDEAASAPIAPAKTPPAP